jgi:hypothetical protein
MPKKAKPVTIEDMIDICDTIMKSVNYSDNSGDILIRKRRWSWRDDVHFEIPLSAKEIWKIQDMLTALKKQRKAANEQLSSVLRTKAKGGDQ